MKGVFLSSLLFFLVVSCTNDSFTTENIIINKKKSIDDSIISLNSSCPPGFELNEKNECIQRNLYQQYDSPNNKGLGGLQTGLPEVRDGFSPQQIDLGRYIFFDPILSKDKSISCASCHQPNKGFTDGLALSKGIEGKTTTRSAPSLWNVAFLKKLKWDGSALSLEEQMQGPLYAENEMGNTPENLLKSLNENAIYQNLFLAAFPKKNTKEISLSEIYLALAAFESSLISLNSRYDQYAHGYHEALNQQELEGLNLFRSFVARCAECHTPPLFTNQQIAVIGTPEPKGRPFDAGAETPNNDKSLRGGFKVPSLRNIALTAPYNHSGRFNNLFETTKFYTQGRGHAVPKNENLIIHWHIWEPKLSDKEVQSIVTFLQTLTDESFKPQIPQKLPSGLKP